MLNATERSRKIKTYIGLSNWSTLRSISNQCNGAKARLECVAEWVGWKGKETGCEGNFLEWFSLKEMKATVDRGGVGGKVKEEHFISNMGDLSLL